MRDVRRTRPVARPVKRGVQAQRRTRARTQAQRRKVSRTRTRSRTRMLSARRYQSSAQTRLRKLRQGSMLAIAITALLLMMWGNPEEVAGQDAEAEAPAAEAAAPATAETPLPESAKDPTRSLEEATGTLREMLLTFYALLPKIVIVLLLLVAAALVANGVRALLHRYLRRWEKSQAISALVRIGLLSDRDCCGVEHSRW